MLVLKGDLKTETSLIPDRKLFYKSTQGSIQH